MGKNPPRVVTTTERVRTVAKRYEELILFIAGLLLGYAFGWAA